MRRLIWLGIFLAVIWTAWWAGGSWMMQRGAQQWLQDRRAEGWQADVAGLRSGGFPNRFALTLRGPALADPETGVAFRASDLNIIAPVYWPGYVSLRLPDDPISLVTPLMKTQLDLGGATADLRLRPGPRLELEAMALRGGAWALGAGAKTLLAANDLEIAMVQHADAAQSYRFDFGADQFRLGPALRQALRVPGDWPVQFDRFAVQADVRFDQPWDRFAIERRRPQPRQISLGLAQATWGDLNLRLAGTLTIDAAGIPTGKLSVQAQNWREILDLAQAAGLLPGALRRQADDSLSALAGLSGNPNSLDIQLNFAGGIVAVGFIPIGPAPRIVIR